jgi:predicted transcriptional regulator of viral defense system
MARTIADRILAVAKEKRIIRPRDLEAKGLPTIYLQRLVANGKLNRIGRGVYSIPSESPTEHHSLAVVAKQVPSGVVCLLSALRFHELTTQQPSEVWLAIGNKAWRPTADSVRIRVVYYGNGSLTEGFITPVIEGVPVKIFNAAKTVADCFKHRRRVGLDVAIEALKDALRQRKATIDQIQKYAEVCRVSRIIRPYLEASV